MNEIGVNTAESGAGDFGKTAVSYIRVSTKEQAERDGDPEGYSIPAQREANRRKAAAKQAMIVEEFVERGESAKHADSRPELQRLLRYLKDHRVDYVIVHKVDRLARNRLDDTQIHWAIKQAGAELVSATENIDETPSGMLLHGIMSSIAEFYSRNLASEVHKGMEQKAKTGGTPGRAPLGYLNVRKVNAEGVEVRTVEVDPARADHITWAFTAYATGVWTLKTMAAELEHRGLTTRRTPKSPGRPIKYNSLYRILTTPYYKGEVVYRGVSYPGRHRPLIDEVTWTRVQDVLTSHATGEKQREFPHYLKSSVFCGKCSSRLIITNAKNPSGKVYPYFVCLGRHQKTNDCQQKAVLIRVVEELVEDHYRTVQLDRRLADQIEVMVRDDLRSFRQAADSERRTLSAQKERLESERMRLLQAHYAGAVPVDLLRQEQDRIARGLAGIEQRLDASAMQFDSFDASLRRAINYAVNCSVGYRHAGTVPGGLQVRRLFNQAFFVRILVDEDTVRVELAEPFRTLLGAEAAVAARRHAQVAAVDSEVDSADAEPESTPFTTGESENEKPTTRVVGLKLATLVPPAGFEPATKRLEGSCSIP